MNIFPFTDPQAIEVTESELAMAEEWAWDFEKLDFKTRDGKMYKVTGKEAVKIWLWKIFQTPRYRYLIYSWDYGHELEDLIGQGTSLPHVESEARRYVEEAVFPTIDGYVESIRNIDIEFEKDKMIINLVVDTPYGEVEISV